MNCIDFKDEYELFFGSATLPIELTEHLQSCAACREWVEEFERLVPWLGTDEDFVPEGTNQEEFVREVNRNIDMLDSRKKIIPLGFKIAGVAAVILLIFGVAFFGGFFNQNGDMAYYNGVDWEETLLANLSVDSTFMGNGDDLLYQIDDSHYEVLIGDFTFSRSFGAAEEVLDMISEEEWEFLEENFNVGDWL